MAPPEAQAYGIIDTVLAQSSPLPSEKNPLD